MSRKDNHMATVNTTPVTAAQSVTPASPLVPALKDYQKERLTKKQAEALGLPCTSKAMPVLGIAEGRHIVWAHANFDMETHDILNAFCQSQDIRTCDLLARVCMQWVETNREALTAAADGFVKVEMSVEELTKRLAAAERAVERNRSLVAKALALAKGEDEQDEDSEPAE